MPIAEMASEKQNVVDSDPVSDNKESSKVQSDDEKKVELVIQPRRTSRMKIGK